MQDDDAWESAMQEEKANEAMIILEKDNKKEKAAGQRVVGEGACHY